jgi:DNA mismatch endonuclease (patch repair protein)
MMSNRRRDTGPELAVRRLLHAQGLRYRVDAPLEFDRRRRADVVFTRARLVVFIDGCFWHGCDQHYSVPATHPEFWAEKRVKNMARDLETNRRLETAGWTVLRFWEHESPDAIAETIAHAYTTLRTQHPDEDPRPDA